MCPDCRSLAWGEAVCAPTGTIHSFVVTHFPQVPSFEYPLPVVLVDVDVTTGGTVRMVMNTADTDPAALAIGASVRIEMRRTDSEVQLPFAVLVTA
jgi:uncharacterized OB-fold protein